MKCFHLKKNQQMRTLSLLKKKNNKIKNSNTHHKHVYGSTSFSFPVEEIKCDSPLGNYTFRRCWHTFVAHTVFVGSFP